MVNRESWRSDAEPLEASWRPHAYATGSDSRPPGKKRKPNMVRRYGWRIYALPVLLVITVYAILDARGGSSDPGEQTNTSQNSSGGAAASKDSPPKSPSATENPVEPIDLDIPTAELPGGGKFTKTGDGEWRVVEGTTDRTGDGGEVYEYTVEVETGLDEASYGGADAFAKMVDATLADPRGWTANDAVSFRRVDDPAEADFRLSLTSPETAHQASVCGYTIKYESSCYRRDLDRVVINLARWVRGAKAFNSDLLTYRQYAINHEVGHALNNGHVGCAKDGALAPVMMQQTFGVANDYVAKLNSADPTNYDAVDKDGKICKPNAWPNP